MLSLTACGTKVFELKDITKIDLTDSSNGKMIEIIEEEQIQTIIQFFADNEFKKGQSSSNSTGWSYRLKFYQNDKIQTDITVMGDGTISFNSYFYDTKDGTIDIMYLDTILSETVGTDYKPMIFVNGVLYDDTGKYVNSLPDNWEHIGDIENVISQSEAMIREEFTSNTLTIGDEIFGSNSEPNKIYVKVPSDKFLIYEVLN